MSQPDHYRTLGVAESSTAEEIKRTYRRLARQWHPDHQGDDPVMTRRFKAITEAHAVLSDPARRAAYDGERRRARAPVTPPPVERPRGTGAAAGVGAFVGRIFGSFSRPRSEDQSQGMDLEAEVRIPFLVAARGGTQSLTIKRDVPCPRCQGTGAEPGSPTAECPACRGGRQPSEAPCATCGGRGHLPRILCRHCQGTGGVAHERTITVRVPAAIESGTRLRIGGEGETGVGGTPNGDLYVTVLVDPHPRWGREGADVHDELALDLGQVILGATVKVNTVNGDVALRIPPGTQPETTFRLTGHGMPRGGESDGRGDHLVRVHVAIPQGLSDEARRMFEEFARSIGLNAERS